VAFSCNLQILVVEEHLYFGLIVLAMSVIKQASVLVMGSSTAEFIYFLCFVDRASLYNLVNEGNLVHNFS
jgi:hypothetical protein